MCTLCPIASSQHKFACDYSYFSFVSLNGNSKSILESAGISSSNGSRSGNLNLGENILDKTGSNNSIRTNLCLKISERCLVKSSKSNNITFLGSRMGGTTGKSDIGLDLVQHANIDSGQLIRGGNSSKKISLAVRSSNIESRERFSLNTVSSISSKSNTARKSQTCRSGNLGQVLYIELGSTAEISGFVISSEVGSFASLERKFESGSGGEGGLESLASVGLELGLVE